VVCSVSGSDQGSRYCETYRHLPSWMSFADLVLVRMGASVSVRKGDLMNRGESRILNFFERRATGLPIQDESRVFRTPAHYPKTDRISFSSYSPIAPTRNSRIQTASRSKRIPYDTRLDKFCSACCTQLDQNQLLFFAFSRGGSC
jgi:hypothetical protein